MREHVSMGRWGAVLAFAGLFAVGCGGPLRYEIHGTPKAPEVDGVIVCKVDKDASMTKLQINVEHLAPPGRLRSDATTYVIWARGGDKNQWQRIGALKYEEGDRKGELMEASVPLTAFELVISVEKQAAPEAPSSEIMLSQQVN